MGRNMQQAAYRAEGLVKGGQRLCRGGQRLLALGGILQRRGVGHVESKVVCMAPGETGGE